MDRRVEMFRDLIDLADPRLFGSLAAEDERPENLATYFVYQPDFKQFEDNSIPLKIVRARKGVGKSALLSKVAYSKKKEVPRPLVILVTGADLRSQYSLKGGTPNELLYYWQQVMCYRINIELGKEIGLARTDPEMCLVEAAELSGFKERNLMGALIARLKHKSININVATAGDSQKLLENYLKANTAREIWLFIDDIDATFRRTPEECLEKSTFFSACRILAHSVEGLYIRASVRADVWATIRASDEALDKCEDHIFTLKWGNSGTRAILVERIKAYALAKAIEREEATASRRKPTKFFSDNIADLSAGQLLRLVFAKPFGWSKSGAANVVHTYSAGRPRWGLRLCKLTVSSALKANPQQKILKFGSIKDVLKEYGQDRLADIINEHKHQCPQIETVISCFEFENVKYSTPELIEFIRDSILSRNQVTIDYEEADSLAVANFLFRIDFLVAFTQAVAGRESGYFRYEEKSNLMRLAVRQSKAVIWLVHKSFRRALTLRNLHPEYD